MTPIARLKVLATALAISNAASGIAVIHLGQTLGTSRVTSTEALASATRSLRSASDALADQSLVIARQDSLVRRATQAITECMAQLQPRT
jgi:hypothetical protein